MGIPNKVADKMPPRGEVRHLGASQVTSPGGPPQIDKDKDPHALVGALDKVMDPP